MDNATRIKYSIKKIFSEENIPRDKMEKFIEPFDVNNKKAVEIVEHMDSIDYDDFMNLGKETGQQFNYTVLVPNVVNNYKKSPILFTDKDIKSLKHTSKVLRENMKIKPNYLSDFFYQVAVKMEPYAEKTETKTKKSNKIIYILLAVLLIILLIFVFARKCCKN